MVGAPGPVPRPAVEWTSATESAPVEAAADTVAMQAVSAEAAQRASDGKASTVAVPEAPPAPAAAPAGGAPEDAEQQAAPASAGPSPSPVALRADAPDGSALDGIDLDVFADAVAQKILHRLTDARIDAIVSERVLEIAERLVREEIERIKADAQ
jgi:hypothetical protein